MPNTVLDAHFHADILMTRQSDFVSLYQDLGLGGLSWSYAHNIASWRDYPAYWQNLSGLCTELNERGVPCYYLVGIHPRCIPDDLSQKAYLPPELHREMGRHLEHHLCRGLGELGLETPTGDEEKVFRWQLDLAVQSLPLDKNIGIHTPRQNKLHVTQTILDIVRRYPELKESLLVDHLNSQVWPLVWDAGYMMGMTLQPGKADIEEVRSVLSQEPRSEDKLILNSDGAKEVSQPFVQAIREGLPRASQTWTKMFYDNAREFWGLD